MSGANHSTKELIIVGTAALALGAAAGVVYSHRETQKGLRRLQRRIGAIFSSLGLDSVAKSISPTPLINGMYIIYRYLFKPCISSKVVVNKHFFLAHCHRPPSSNHLNHQPKSKY
jgi:hypothetical protein